MVQEPQIDERRGLAIGLILLAGLAAALRLHGLGRWSLWLDEAMQYKESAAPLSKLYDVMYAQDVPVSVILGHALIWAGFDGSEWQLRLPSAIFGTGIVVLVFLLARELLGTRVAFLAGLGACVMPVLVEYSQEYRSYSLLVFFTTLGAWALAVALRTNGAGWWALFAGAAILSLYTHFVALFFMSGMGLFFLASVLLKLWRGEPIWPKFWSGTVAFAIIGIAYIPALPLLAGLVEIEAKFALPAATVLDRLTLLDKIVFEYPRFGPGDARLIVAGLAGIGVIWTAYRSPRALLFLLCAFLAPALLYAFFGLARASSVARYTLPLMAPYAIAVGAGLAAISFGVEALARRWRLDASRAGRIATTVLAASLVLLSVNPLSRLYAANPKPRPVDLREAFDHLRTKMQPDDLLLEASTATGGSVYWFPAYESYYARARVWPKMPTKGIVDDHNFPKDIAAYFQKSGRLWVVVTLSDLERPAFQSAGGDRFETQCFRMICIAQSRDASRPMAEQIGTFFDRFANIDPDGFSAAARAVRAKLDPGASVR